MARLESDSMGAIEVPDQHYWGAQTQRSIHYFRFGQAMPLELVHAFGALKAACAEVNMAKGRLAPELAALIVAAAEEVAAGTLDAEFPLKVWQTGSGTQTNMNVNEVIANRAIQASGGVLGSKSPVHPNDHVNLSQSSNDTFPAALHVAVAIELQRSLIPAVEALSDALGQKAEAFAAIIKIGRTHLQDAVPLSLGQEFSGYGAQLDLALETIRASLPQVRQLAIGGTAVGTGHNAPAGFGEAVSARLAERLGLPFTSAPNKFQALAGHEPLAAAHGVCTQLPPARFCSPLFAFTEPFRRFYLFFQAKSTKTWWFFYTWSRTPNLECGEGTPGNTQPSEAEGIRHLHPRSPGLVTHGATERHLGSLGRRKRVNAA